MKIRRLKVDSGKKMRIENSSKRFIVIGENRGRRSFGMKSGAHAENGEHKEKKMLLK